MLLEVIDDRRFALAIGARDPVVARFQIGVLAAEVFPMFEQDCGAAAGRFHGDFDVVHAFSGRGL